MQKICYVVTIGTTIEAFFMEQLKYLSCKGYSITVVCNDDCKLSEKLQAPIDLIDVKIPRGMSFFSSLKALLRLRNVFKKSGFDMIQYSTPNAAFLASVAARIARVPIRNYHIMGYRFESESGLKLILLKLLDKIACHLSTHIECVCESTRSKGITLGLFDSEKAVVVGYGSTGGVNQVRFNISKKQAWRNQIYKEYSINQKSLVFGFVGRIVVDKGIRELFASWEKFVQKNPDAVLMMIGPSEDDNLVKKGNKLPRVIFTGAVSDPERYFASLDVLLLPSYREGFGNVLIEAETMGVACIASDISGPRDAVRDGVTGILVPPHDEQALLGAMITLNNTEKRRLFSENAIEYAKEFESGVLCEKIYERKRFLLGFE